MSEKQTRPLTKKEKIILGIILVFVWSGIAHLFGWADTSKECNPEKYGYAAQLTNAIKQAIYRSPDFQIRYRTFGGDFVTGNLMLETLKLSSDGYKEHENEGIVICTISFDSEVEGGEGKAYYTVKKDGDKVYLYAVTGVKVTGNIYETFDRAMQAALRR